MGGLVLSGLFDSFDQGLRSALTGALAAGIDTRQAGAAARIAAGLVPLWLALLALSRAPPPLDRALWAMLLLAQGAAIILFEIEGRFWLPPLAPMITLALARPLWSWRRTLWANAVMAEELASLSPDPAFAARRGETRPGQDPITDQTRLARETVSRVRGLRRLVNAAIRSLPDATVIIALHGEIVLANDQARRLFRAREEVAREDVEAFFAASHPPPFSPEAFMAPEGDWSGERRGADGSLRDIRYVTWSDEGGDVLGWVVRFADISALRRAERAREEALQLLTHDMRSPQASILALVANRPSDFPEAIRERIARYAKRTIALADSYLQLARADEGAYDMRPVDLADVMAEAVDDLWPLATAKGITIRQSRSEADCAVLGNRSLLMRAFANLLDNAVKFSEPGSRIDCELLRETRPGGAVVIASISDHGAGIAPDALERIFERFSPQHAPNQREPGGVGLGLAFVQSVVEGHGGRVSCRSVVGQGSIFDLEFPALRFGAET